MSASINPEIAVTAGDDAALEQAVLRKVTRRLIPLLFVLYMINMLDRTNVGIAKLQMLQDLDLGEDVYGLGAGLFYVGYLVFELPSNLILTRIGARVWIARILLSWGVVSCSMMFVSGKWSFYALRILLGVAEAGFFPGIILYLSQWFPARARARAVAKFMAASAITMILGNPLSGAILQYMNHVAGLAGWQWVFLLEGLPAIILGFITIRYLTDRPEQAEWLKPAERDWLVQQLHSERQQLGHDREHTLRAALVNPRVWLLTGVYFAAAMGDNTFGFYLPTFLADMLPEWSKAQIGMLAAAPCVVALVAMILVGVHSDRTGERRWHVAGPAFAAAAGWVLAIWAQSPWFYLLALALTTAGMKSMLGTFWTLPMSMLKGTAAAGGIALINSVANLGGLVGPYVMGYFAATRDSYVPGKLLMVGVLCAGAILVLFARRDGA